MAKKDELYKIALSLENEIEVLKENKIPTRSQKIELNKVYKELKRQSNLQTNLDLV